MAQTPNKPDDEFTRDLDRFSRTAEVLLARPPRFLSGVLVGLVAFFLAVGLWAAFAKVDIVVRAGGTVRPMDQPMKVQTKAGGKIKDVHVEFGDQVQEGELLVTFDTRDIQRLWHPTIPKFRDPVSPVPMDVQMQGGRIPVPSELAKWAENPIVRYLTAHGLGEIPASHSASLQLNMLRSLSKDSRSDSAIVR